MTSSTPSRQRAAVTEGPDRIVVQDVDTPVVGPGDALLRVEAVGICGTDLKILSGGFPAEYPLVQGHELSAIVEVLPDGYAGNLVVGERVAVNPPVPCGHCYACSIERWSTCETMSVVGVNRPGALQERMTMPVQNLYPVGDLDPEVAAVCETLSVGLRAVTRPSVAAGDRVLILGAGPIGLAALIASLDVGATAMVVDRARSRREHATALGAEVVGDDLATVADEAKRWTGGDGPSVVVDAIGLASSLELAFEAVAVAGRISIVGISQQIAQLNVRTFTAKELAVFGSRGTLDFASAVALATRQREKVASLISHRFPLADIQGAFDTATTQPDEVVKCLIEIDRAQ